MRRFFCFLLMGVLILSLSACAFFGPNPNPDVTTLAPKPSFSTNTEGPVTDTEPPLPDPEEKPAYLTEKIGDLTEKEQDALAEYLFATYIPCSYGIFADVSKVSSPSVWSSVEALNRAIDKDESAASRELKNVRKKVEIYFPHAEFNPEKVKVYDKTTQTFAPSPAQHFEYVLLSYEVKGQTITVYYEDKPDANDPEFVPEKYATTLKNSTAEGYFAFVSSVKTDAVG